MSKQTDLVKEKIIEALDNYEGSAFVVNNSLRRFIRHVDVGRKEKTTAEIAQALSTKTKSLVVVLSSCGNPDFGQYAPLSEVEIVQVANMQEASDKCIAYRDQWDLGGGNWDGGQIYHPTRGQIAYVSYNGSVWPGRTYREDNIAYTDEQLLLDVKQL